MGKRRDKKVYVRKKRDIFLLLEIETQEYKDIQRASVPSVQKCKQSKRAAFREEPAFRNITVAK